MFPAYVYTKQVEVAEDKMLVKSGDPTDETQWPAWRGIYDFRTKGLKTKGHNTAIKGLFEKLGTEPAGYTKVEWGLAFANDINNVLQMVVSGIKSETDVPRPYWPIPLETITQSNGKVTNGYGLPNQ